MEIDQLAGRITVGLITPYPPGIPLLIPGEVFSQKIVDYLLFAREFSKLCPGFETDIHGLVEVEDEHGEVRFYADCVAQPADSTCCRACRQGQKSQNQQSQIKLCGPGH